MTFIYLFIYHILYYYIAIDFTLEFTHSHSDFNKYLTNTYFLIIQYKSVMRLLSIIYIYIYYMNYNNKARDCILT